MLSRNSTSAHYQSYQRRTGSANHAVEGRRTISVDMLLVVMCLSHRIDSSAPSESQNSPHVPSSSTPNLQHHEWKRVEIPWKGGGLTMPIRGRDILAISNANRTYVRIIPQHDSEGHFGGEEELSVTGRDFAATLSLGILDSAGNTIPLFPVDPHPPSCFSEFLHEILVRPRLNPEVPNENIVRTRTVQRTDLPPGSDAA